MDEINSSSANKANIGTPAVASLTPYSGYRSNSGISYMKTADNMVMVYFEIRKDNNGNLDHATAVGLMPEGYRPYIGRGGIVYGQADLNNSATRTLCLANIGGDGVITLYMMLGSQPIYAAIGTVSFFARS